MPKLFVALILIHDHFENSCSSFIGICAVGTNVYAKCAGEMV